LVLVFNGISTWTYYLDGVQMSTGTFGTAINTNIANVKIGARTGSGYINGAIDDVRIYNRALSSDEVQMLYRDH